MGSNGCTCLIIPVFNDKKNANERGRGSCCCFFLPSCLPVSFFSFFLLFVLFVSLKKESPDGCKAKNHKYWVPSFGEFNVFSSVKSSAQRQHYLVVLLVFVRI